MKKVLNDKIKSKTFTSSKLTYSGIVAKINANNPVILMGTEKTSSDSSQHALLCYGYDKSDSNNLVLYIYDPWKDGSYTSITCTSERATTFTYGSMSFSLGTAVYTNSSTT